jgi:hypothetical protein
MPGSPELAANRVHIFLAAFATASISIPRHKGSAPQPHAKQVIGWMI